jgi:hypothetical protein
LITDFNIILSILCFVNDESAAAHRGSQTVLRQIGPHSFAPVPWLFCHKNWARERGPILSSDTFDTCRYCTEGA